MSLFDSLHPLTKAHRTAASTVLANAFSEKPMLKKLGISQGDMRTMFEIVVRFGLRYGDVYATSPNLEGVIVFLPQKYAQMKIWHMIRSGAIFPALKLNKQLMSLMKESEKIMEQEKKHLAIGDYLYLLSIGIAYEHQGKGMGGKLLNALLEKADNEKRSIYLETDTPENIKLYQHYGFKILKEYHIHTPNIPMWTMARVQ